MSNENGKISPPVEIEDVRTVLGVSSYDLGTLCGNIHGQTNPWARYKPVRYSKLIPAETDLWWRAEYGDCGIEPKDLTGYQEVLYFCNGDMNGWVYKAPLGGYATPNPSPYRLLDFEGYNHNAKFPLTNFYATPVVANKFSSAKITVTAIRNNSSTDVGGLSDNLSFSDITTVKDCYLGVVMRKTTWADELNRVYTTTNTVSEGALEINIPVQGITMGVGIYNLYPFLSTEIYDGINTPSGAIHYSIPGAIPLQSEVIDSFIDVSGYADAMPRSPQPINFTVRITNNQVGGAATLTTNVVKLRFVSNDFGSPTQTGETQTVLDTITVPAESTIEVTGTIQVSQQLVDAGTAKIWFSLGTGNYVFGLQLRHDISIIPPLQPAT